MLIFFIRHGLTDWNAQRRFQGTCDIPLNAVGIAQAQAAARRCASLRIERVYHSPLLRAAKTAHIIASACEVPLLSAPRFSEIDMGHFQGLTRDQANAQFPAESAAYWSDPVNCAPPNGETLLQVQRRGLEALALAESDACGARRIAIVSHGALLKALFCAISGIPLENFAHFDVSNGSVSVVESQNGSRRLITLNDLSHFDDPYESMEATRLLI